MKTLLRIVAILTVSTVLGLAMYCIVQPFNANVTVSQEVGGVAQGAALRGTTYGGSGNPNSYGHPQRSVFSMLGDVLLKFIITFVGVVVLKTFVGRVLSRIMTHDANTDNRG
jgi:hypothetical protein